MDRKNLWAGEGAKPAQSRRNPVGIEACYGEFCPDTGIGHSNDAFFRVRHYGSFRGMGYVGEDSEKRKAHFPLGKTCVDIVRLYTACLYHNDYLHHFCSMDYVA